MTEYNLGDNQSWSNIVLVSQSYLISLVWPTERITISSFKCVIKLRHVILSVKLTVCVYGVKSEYYVFMESNQNIP